MSGTAGRNTVTRTVSGFLIPFMQLYSLYLIAHGDLGPGGGFQGGAIFAASLILYAIVFGLDRETEKRYARVAGGAAGPPRGPDPGTCHLFKCLSGKNIKKKKQPIFVI